MLGITVALGKPVAYYPHNTPLITCCTKCKLVAGRKPNEAMKRVGVYSTGEDVVDDIAEEVAGLTSDDEELISQAIARPSTPRSTLDRLSEVSLSLALLLKLPALNQCSSYRR
jgi:hypothetical protein